MADIFEFDCAKYFNLSDFDSFEECSSIDPWFNATHEEHEPQFVSSMLGEEVEDKDIVDLASAPVAKVNAPIVKFDMKAPSANTSTRNKRVPEPLAEAIPSKKHSSRLNTASSLAKTVRPSVSRAATKSTKTATTRKTDTKPATKTVKRSSVSAKSSEDDALLLMLKQHNKKFAPVAAYVPPMHSVREVRQWEKLTGKQWNTLSQTQREEANEEISELKHAKRII